MGVDSGEDDRSPIPIQEIPQGLSPHLNSKR